jgi:hypothetical protein
MFESLALIGGFWFFLIAIAVLAGGIISAECDNLWGAGLTLALLAGTSELLFNIPVLASIAANPLLVGVGLAAYTAVALLYAVFYRYAAFLRSNSYEIADSWSTFQKKNVTGTREDFRQSEHYRRYTPLYNVDRISTWALLWPWAMFWDLCHKPARWFYDTMYSLAGRMLNAVGARVSDGIIDTELKKQKK